MAKRFMFAVVGAGLGGLVGLVVAFVAGGSWAILLCGAAGALAPFVLGPPGRHS